MTLVLTDVSVHFGDVRAVDRVSLTVDDGSVLALIGPSGCGKSTLLRAVAGLVTSSGTIAWRGEDLADVATERRDIGFMFQDHALFTHRSVGDNVAFGLRMRNVEAADQRVRVDELLELVGLGGFADRSVEHLSGGEAQRVALARALAPRPRLLLLDEPLASLDRARRDELNEELAALLVELRQTAIYVTHDQHEAFAIAEQVAVMHEGSLVRSGRPADLWRNPGSEFVARFLGHETIVELDGRRVAVPTDAVRLVATSDADRQGVVTRCRFQGDRHRIELTAGSTTWSAYARERIEPGTRVGFVVDHNAVATLDG